MDRAQAGEAHGPVRADDRGGGAAGGAGGRRARAGLKIEPECDRVGVSFATAMGGLKSFEDACDTLD